MEYDAEGLGLETVGGRVQATTACGGPELGGGDAANQVFLLGLGFGADGEGVEEIGAELAAKTVEIGASGGGVARPGFGEYDDFIALDVLERFGNVRMAAVGIGGIEEAQAVVVSVKEQVRETFDTERVLVRMMTAANGAGTHGETAGLDARFAEGHSVCGADLARENRKSERTPREGGRMNPGGTCSASGAMDEIATFHAASLLRSSRG